MFIRYIWRLLKLSRYDDEVEKKVIVINIKHFQQLNYYFFALIFNVVVDNKQSKQKSISIKIM